MSDLKLTPSLLAMLERIEQHNGTLLMLSVTASGGQDGKLNKLRGAGYVVKCDHPSVTDGAWPAEALAITDAGRTALAKHRAEIAGEPKHRGDRQQGSGDGAHRVERLAQSIRGALGSGRRDIRDQGVARSASEEKMTCDASVNSGSSSCVARSASSTCPF